jgi:hypothetical protein
MHMGEAKWDIEGPIEVAGGGGHDKAFPVLVSPDDALGAALVSS